MRHRVLRGIGSNVYGQGVTVMVQLVTVPGFAHVWGSQRLGLWLMLAAAASTLTMADCGVTATTASAMTMAMGRGDPVAAGRLFAQAVRFVGAATLVLAAGLLAATVLVETLPPAVETAAGATGLLAPALLLSCASLVALHSGNLDVAFRANGDYAAGSAAVSTIRLVEMVAALGTALCGGGLAAAAAAILGVRAIGTAAMAVALRRRAPWVRFRAEGLGWDGLRPLARPALAALAMPVGLALTLQGVTIVAGAVVSAGAVTVFVASRTLTRVIVQVLGLFNHALMPEMSMAAGRSDGRRSLALLRLNLLLGLAMLVPGWVALLIFGPALLSWWTGGALAAEPAAFGMMATAALCHGAWLSASNVLLATNRQADYAYRFVGFAVATCLAAWPLGAAFGLPGIAGASLLGEVAMVALILPNQILVATRRRGPIEGLGL